jgi:hypothetical protein
VRNPNRLMTLRAASRFPLLVQLAGSDMMVFVVEGRALQTVVAGEVQRLAEAWLVGPSV